MHDCQFGRTIILDAQCNIICNYKDTGALHTRSNMLIKYFYKLNIVFHLLTIRIKLIKLMFDTRLQTYRRLNIALRS